MATELNFDGRFSVASMTGVAFRLKGYATEQTEPADVLVCEDPDCMHDGAECYVTNDPETIEDRSRVVAVMVGDDYEHIVSADDLTEIHEGDYCGGCGQIGCTADGR